MKSLLEPLKQFEGSWTKKFTVHKSPWVNEAHTETGAHVAKWVLDQRHLQEIGKDSDGSTYMSFYSYDAETRDYRLSIFTSAGSVWQFAGKWDPAAKTFLWTRTMPDGVRMTATYQFVRPDEVKFRYVASKKDGAEILFQLDGVGQRVESK